MNNLQKEAYKIRLTPEEKATMRRNIFGVPSTVATHSPYFFFNFQFKHTFVPVMALLVVLFGTGTAYAAQGSLPGDILYPVKIHVNEPVEVALAATPAAKATVEAKLAGRRVAEAQTLASQGKLDATTTAELQADFKVHEAQAIALADTADDTDKEQSRADTAATTTSTTTTTSTVVVTVAVAPATAPKTMSALRVTEEILPATTTSTTTVITATAHVASTSIPGAALRGGLREKLQQSLNAQASILNTLQVDIEQHGDIRRAGRHATSTRGDQD